jgi:hypothetical protein
MATSTGLVLAAGGIAIANEVIFAPLESGKGVDLTAFNWRIVPATAVLALVLGGLSEISEPLGKGFAGLVLLAVLVIPVGNAPTPLESAGKVFGNTGKAFR